MSMKISEQRSRSINSDITSSILYLH